MRDLTRVLFAVVIFLVAPVAAHAQRRRAVVPPPSESESEYVRAARQAANWIATMERPVPPDGLSWSWSEANKQVFLTGIDSGASGIGFFYLRLYEVTRDPAYLAKAKGAANFVDAQLRAHKPASFDWLNGAAGSGAFLVAVYRATHEERYLDGARFLGDWLLDTAIPDGSGVYWKASSATNTYTGVAHGAAGIGLFLLDLYETTQQPKYLDTASKAFEWLMAETLPAGGGVVWKRLVSDNVTYPGWCGGSSGVGLFLRRLASITNDPRHLDASIRAAEGLVNTAIAQAGDESAWDFYGPNTGYGIIYCHGASSVAATMADAYRFTGDARYLATARSAAKWVAHYAVHEQAGLSWNHFYGSALNHYTGLMLGAASAGHMFLRVHRVDPDPQYLDLAGSAAAYLLAIADHPARDQSRWINYTSTPLPGDDPKTYETGWYIGAAGIGIFFLELDDALRGRQPLESFSGMNP